GIPSSPRALPHSLSSLASRTLVLRIPAAAADLLPTRQRRISTPPSDPMAASSRLDGRLVTAVLKQDRAWRVRAGRRRDCIARPGHQQAANDIEDSNAARICMSPLFNFSFLCISAILMLRASSHPRLAPACRSTKYCSSPSRGSEPGRTLRPGAVARLQPNGHVSPPLDSSRILRVVPSMVTTILLQDSAATLPLSTGAAPQFGCLATDANFPLFDLAFCKCRCSLHESSTDAAVLPHCSHLPSLHHRCNVIIDL
ncbi:unnamed protein product, partial [Urochloa humidicola]